MISRQAQTFSVVAACSATLAAALWAGHTINSGDAASIALLWAGLALCVGFAMPVFGGCLLNASPRIHRVCCPSDSLPKANPLAASPLLLAQLINGHS